MLVTTISLKKAQLLRARLGHNESGDTCNFIPPHLLCHSHVTQYLVDFLRYLNDRRDTRNGRRGGEKEEGENERKRDGNALKKNGEKSDARISSNPCANVAQWNSLEGPPLAKGCRSCRYCGRRIKGLLWRKKRRRKVEGGWTTGRVEHRCPRIGIFRIIFPLPPPFARLFFLSSALLFAIHPLARPSIHRFALCDLN